MEKRGTGNLLRRYGHLPLIAAFGVLAVVEGIRIGTQFTAETFIAGPGGYMTVIGVALCCFALIGVLGATAGRTRRKRTQDELAALDTDTDTVTTPEKSAEAIAHSRTLRLSFLLCVVYVLLIKPLGFTIASLLYLAASLWFLKNPLRRTLLTCIIMFPILFFGLPAIGISVPRGPFGF
jgi:low temperature requirement protein LtrA